MAIDKRNRQTHYVLIRPLDRHHELRCQSLNRIRTCFTDRFPAPSVLRNLFIRQFREQDFRGGYIGQGGLSLGKKDSGMDAMPPPGEEAQHAAGVFFVPRLAEDFVVQGNYRVGTEDDIAPATLDSASLLFGHAADKFEWQFIWARNFGYGSRPHEVVDSGREQQFVAARGSGGEDQHFSSR